MDIDKKIDLLISEKQYCFNESDKDAELFPIIFQQIKNQTKKTELGKFYNNLKPLNEIKSLSDIPPIPVSLFKENDLCLVKKEEVVRVLTSSGTTGQKRSKIYLDKKTAFRQSKALTSILKDHLGVKRRPLLVIDTAEVNNSKDSEISARGAAIRGLIQFSNEVTYVFDGKEELKLNLERLNDFFKRNSQEEVLIFGFTYIIWKEFYQVLSKIKEKSALNLKGILIHSGGWKKLINEKVSKEIFNKKISEIFGFRENKIYDMYGLVEQVGVVFIDCEAQNKHSPNFAKVIIKNPTDLGEVQIGEPGLIEILSVLPESYPGQAIITEDVGVLVGRDNCPCGRKGEYFRFISRVEKSESRGCGDTYLEKKK